MTTKYLACLFLLLIALPALAQTSLLQKQPDGSTLIARENVWAILRGRIGKYDNEYLTTDRVVGLLWDDQLSAIKDEFLRHDDLVHYEHLLDDATAQAKSIGPVTFVFYPAVSNYDFNAQAFPAGRYGYDQSRSFPGSVYVTFDRTLASKIPVPEDQARAVAQALKADQGGIECRVTGTIKQCRLTRGVEKGLPGWQPKMAEEEPTVDYFKMILTVHSVEYRLKTQGTVLLTKSFDDAHPSPSAASGTPPP